VIKDLRFDLVKTYPNFGDIGKSACGKKKQAAYETDKPEDTKIKLKNKLRNQVVTGVCVCVCVHEHVCCVIMCRKMYNQRKINRVNPVLGRNFTINRLSNMAAP
jgi:hypothetical protein